MIKSYVYYVLASFAEIAGCFSFWAWLRLKKSAWVIFPGLVSLVAFAYFLTKVNSDFAGRSYTVYGSIYIAASFVWLWLVEAKVPDKWDSIGVGISLLGGAVIFYGHR